jgi:hypothetical protein
MIVGCSSISGAAHHTAGKIALRAIAFYMGTTILAAMESLTWMFFFQDVFTRADTPGAPAMIPDVVQGRYFIFLPCFIDCSRLSLIFILLETYLSQ